MADTYALQASYLPISFRRLLIQLIQRPHLLLSVVLGLTAILLMPVTSTSVARASEVEVASHLDDGTYIFGESPEANQIGKTYTELTH